MLCHMRTTINLPDELYRSARVRAAQDGRTVTSLLEEAIRRLLEEFEDDERSGYRVRPLTGGATEEGLPIDDNAALRALLDEADR